MSKETKFVIYVLSDTIGQSAVNLTKAALSKYPELDYILKEFTFLTEVSEVERVLDDLKREKNPAIVFHALADKELALYVDEHVSGHCEDCHDILSPIIDELGNVTGQKTKSTSDQTPQQLDETYFDRIRSLEFAVAHDDGKDPRGFLEADIVILGISRTSKTPLSIYLANNNYKVANLPLLPEAELPAEIWQVDPRRIIGLTNDVDVLSKIRKERMISYGMNPETVYSNPNRIDEEIDYAYNLYEELGCKVINVANRSIEETAARIISYLNEEGLYHSM